jgi:hypothetical protein
MGSGPDKTSIKLLNHVTNPSKFQLCLGKGGRTGVLALLLQERLKLDNAGLVRPPEPRDLRRLLLLRRRRRWPGGF